MRELDVIASADHAELVSGRLAITDRDLMGPADAADGHGVTLGAIQASSRHGPLTQRFDNTTFLYAPQGAADGGWLALGIERRAFAFAFDMSFSSAAISGIATRAPLGTAEQPIGN